MGKYLDSIDYNKIVFNTFQLPESDFLKYYSNVVEDHLADNNDLFDELLAAIDRRINWYRDQHKPDYSFDSQGVDKKGNKIIITNILDDWDEADEVYIPLFIHYGINRSINKSFFDEQIRIVQVLSIQHNIRNTVTKLREKSTKGRKVKTFEGLFSQKEIAKKVIKILTDNDCLASGIWNYQGNNKSVATPFYVLRDYFGLINPDESPIGTKLKTWCSGMGITANPGYIKNLKNNPDTNGKNPTIGYRREQKEFFKLFELHFLPTKQLE
jgi:hypothetical protein